MHFFARLRIDLQMRIYVFSNELLVLSIFHRENLKSELHTPLNYQTNLMEIRKKQLPWRATENLFGSLSNPN